MRRVQSGISVARDPKGTIRQKIRFANEYILRFLNGHPPGRLAGYGLRPGLPAPGVIIQAQEEPGSQEFRLSPCNQR